MHEHLGQCLSEAKKKIDWLMKIQYDPFTLNNHYLADYKEKFMTYYRRIRKDSKTNNNRSLRAVLSASAFRSNERPAVEVVDPTAAALSALANLGFHGLKGEDLGKLLGQDKMEPALEVMATVRAYFQGT